MLNKIYNEDCLEGMKRIQTGSVDMILCDLPYGTTACKWDTVIPFEPLWEQYERVIKPNGAIVLTAAQPFTTMLVNSNPALFKYDLIWHKRTPSGVLNANKMPIRTHETVLIFYKRLPLYNPQKTQTERRTGIKLHKVESSVYGKADRETEYVDDGSRFPTSVIDITGVVNNSRQKVKHPTQKPVDLFAWLIRTYTNPGDTVLDNCMGSGTTAVACIQEGRNFIGFEKEPEYYQICLNRIDKAATTQTALIF